MYIVVCIVGESEKKKNTIGRERYTITFDDDNNAFAHQLVVVVVRKILLLFVVQQHNRIEYIDSRSRKELLFNKGEKKRQKGRRFFFWRR